MDTLPEGTLELMNARRSGFNELIGLSFVKIERDEVITEIAVGPSHVQPYGLVHGGVYASMIETTCSAAAAVNVMADGKMCVGLENSTSFLRAVRAGTLRCTAVPLQRGRRSHVWQADVRGDDGKLVATGRVRMIILEQGAAAGGEALSLKT